MSPSMAAATASASPNGTIRKPGVYGPYPRRASSSVEKEMIVVVRPWKLPAITMIPLGPLRVDPVHLVAPAARRP